MGPNRHVGLDFTKRSMGGWKWTARLFNNTESSTGIKRTYPWFEDELANNNSGREKLVLFAHHPLTALSWILPIDQFQSTERTKIANSINDTWGSKRTHWFAGHYHTGDNPSRRWAVGLDPEDDQDTIIEVHLYPGIYGKEECANGDKYYVGYVKVYGDFVCDFTISPNPAQKRQTVTFTSTSNHYGGSISEYAWNFGDGSSNFYVLTDEVSHTYNKPGVYWIKHRVKSGNQYAYMIRLLKVIGCPNNPHLEVEIRKESPGPSGFMFYLGPPVKYKADLEWWFDTTGSGAEFHRYFGGREYPYKDHFITNSVYGSGASSHRAQPDPLDLQKHQTYKWSVYAEVTCEGESTPRSLGSNLVTKTPGGDTSSGGCPVYCDPLGLDTVDV